MIMTLKDFTLTYQNNKNLAEAIDTIVNSGDYCELYTTPLCYCGEYDDTFDFFRMFAEAYEAEDGIILVNVWGELENSCSGEIFDDEDSALAAFKEECEEMEAEAEAWEREKIALNNWIDGIF